MTVNELARKVFRKRNEHLEKWLRKHLEILNLDVDKDLLGVPPDVASRVLAEVYGLELREWTLNLYNDTEKFQLFKDGKQIGTTLLIQHKMDELNHGRIELHINEELPEEPRNE